MAMLLVASKLTGIGLLSVVVGVLSGVGAINSIIIGGLFFVAATSIVNAKDIMSLRESIFKIEKHEYVNRMIIEEIAHKENIDINKIEAQFNGDMNG